MESYRDFLERINSFEKRELYLGDEYFKGNPSLSQKVDRINRFRAFFGDTIVFNLDEVAKKKVTGIVDKIYDIAPECFCEKLVPNTFHMTLHDLSNSPVFEDITVEVSQNERNVVNKSKQVCMQKIKMRSKYIFNMVNTSLVLGLYPVNEREYNKLMELYYLFDDVKKLDYPFTPHITLAYYNINGFDMEAARKLESIIYELNANEIEIELDTKELFYQKFVSMNEYTNVVKLVQNYMSVNGIEYKIVKLLGHGKGGYSYLVERNGNFYVLKQIHHEPCEYYTFGNKIEAEQNDYNRLLQTGIRIPRMLDIDIANERILKEYIDGPSIYDLVKSDSMKDLYLAQMQEMAKVVYEAGLNIDYFPTNFIVQDDRIFYIDYECNQYMDEWNFENWGVKYWSKT